MLKNNYIYIEHIQNCARKILSYTKGMDEDAFLSNEIVQDAVIRNFEIIGEASKQLSEDFKKEHEQIPWKEMAGMRDILIHDYIGTDLWAVWNTVTQYIPELTEKLDNISKSD
jgi:uncharacterized protein with HEPN domain